MPNDNLKHALDRAGLTPDQFADIISVDPRTVERWVAGRTPYRRHRATISRALDLTEHELWPNETPPPRPAAESAQGPTADMRSSENNGSADPVDALTAVGVSEVVATWGRSNVAGTPSVGRFLRACERVELFDAGSGLLPSPGTIDRLRECAERGTQVRVIAKAATDELRGLAGVAGVEVRILDAVHVHALLRADARLLLGLSLVDGGMPPLLQVERRVDDGLFDRLTQHFAVCWDAGEPLTGASTSQSSRRRWPGRGE